KAPLEFLNAVFASSKPEALKDFAAQISSQFIANQEPSVSRDLVISLAAQPARADVLKQVVLESLAKGMKPGIVPPWTRDLQTAFQSLLTAPNPALNAAAFPLIARWDQGRVMAGELKPLLRQLNVKLNDAALPDDQRAQLVNSLLSVRQMDPD